MSRSVAREEIIGNAFGVNQQSIFTGAWVSQGLFGMVLVSLFMIVYMNFAIRVATTRLNGVMASSVRLQSERDGLILEKERLQMHHHTEKRARESLGYRLAKDTKVVNIHL